MHSETTQVIHEHAAPTHIKENGNTSDGRHHCGSLAGESSYNECNDHGGIRTFLTHSSIIYRGTFTNKEKSVHHESSQEILLSPPHSYGCLTQTPIVSTTTKGSNCLDT